MEITATDLRIGNWLCYGNNVFQADSKLIFNIDKHDLLAYGIPLTPEILLKMGFEKQEFTWSIKGLRLGIKVNEAETPYFMTGYSFTPILYVHTLQNLYNILSGGKELIFEL